MARAYYSDTISRFLAASRDEVLGALVAGAEGFPIELSQRDAWLEEVDLLKRTLHAFQGRGHIYLEYNIPRLGRRIDAVAIVDHLVFVIEFKVGETAATRAALDQVWDYGLDLKNFHETTHNETVFPVLVPTRASNLEFAITRSSHGDGLFRPAVVSPESLADFMWQALAATSGKAIAAESWNEGRYSPTPTIIEAALALYANHGVAEISRSDAGAINLSRTTSAISDVIAQCRASGQKAICFVTGVPGAGKTLVGLNIATKYAGSGALHSVFLSGNGPLVAILREALARDRVRRESERGNRIAKKIASSEVNAFVQNVHHFRDEYLQDSRPPSDRIAVFDEAQRAWDLEKTADFMRRKRGRPDFRLSEPEFLISCLDRHQDWAVVVCLVGGGQEINTGEAGISEWLRAIRRSFPHWSVFISPELTEEEYGAVDLVHELAKTGQVREASDLHLAVSMRSYRAEHVSSLVKQLLDLDAEQASRTLTKVRERYPILLTRDLVKAKRWLRDKARGSERYGLLVSSQALRLKPLAIDVRTPTDPILWFLNDKDDTRSSYYLEDAATEFDVQGLELDWSCVVWDGDFRYSSSGWQHRSFVGAGWQKIAKAERQMYLKNAYRVLLTRARQGMVIVVPEGNQEDPTRLPEFYDPTYEYLCSLGLQVLH